MTDPIADQTFGFKNTRIRNRTNESQPAGGQDLKKLLWPVCVGGRKLRQETRKRPVTSSWLKIKQEITSRALRSKMKANHKVVEAPGSKIKQEITKILYEQGYILAYKFDTDEKGHPSIKIALKWDAATKGNAIKDLKRVSRPGLRQYVSVADMPRVLNGLGIAVLSTSKGIMTDAKARKENVGGEVLCYIY